MSSLHKHCSDCIRKIGKPYKEVHEFLDQYFKTDGPEYHRQRLHHQYGIELVREKFGDEAAKAAEIHIREDFFGLLPPDADHVRMWMEGMWP